MNVLSYFFWPRPPAVGYDNPKLQIVLTVSVFLIILSFVLRLWRKQVKNPQTKKLSRSWAAACIWFGIIGLILSVSRAEDISYLSMRFLWVLWIVVLVLYLFLQIRLFRSRHYEVLSKEQTVDEREKYLPKKKYRK